jgi:hypothetical protein
MTMLFSADVKLAGTCYVNATSQAEAKEKIERWLRREAPLEFSGPGISELRFDNPNLPEISLSPAFTAHGIWEGQLPQEVE